MSKKIKLTVLFLILNFASLAIGSWLMDDGPRDIWYQNLTKAPWTPPGWVFGAAWSFIMICFSIYLANLFLKQQDSNATFVYCIQLVLNISWNYAFFNQHQIALGLIILLLLNIVLSYFFFSLSKNITKIRLLLLPYMIWMCIATSLNLYILIHN